MKRLFLFLFCILIFASSHAQKLYKITGFIYDANTKETLIGATIRNLQGTTGTTANVYGFYTFTTKSNTLELEYSYVGYEKKVMKLNLTKDTTIDVYLSVASLIQEVVVKDVSASRRYVTENIPGKMEVNPQIVSSMPTLMGESDLLKAIQTLPGVKNGTEGSSGLYVRGGNVDQNLYLIDGIEVYNPNHLMGFISTFNTDAIKNIDFYKGAFPASYSGRASSVMDVRTKDGANDKIKGDFSIGLISAKVNLEGPLIKDKTTFSLSFRRTYMDLILKPIIYFENKRDGDDSDFDFQYYFTDINAKVKHRFNAKNSITASFYMGRDTYGIEMTDDYMDSYSNTDASVSWGNVIATIDYAAELSSGFFSNLSLSYNKYFSKISNTNDMKDDFEGYNYKSTYNYNSGVEDITLKNNYNYYLNGWNTFDFGFNYIYHHYTPEITSYYSFEDLHLNTAPYKVDHEKDANEFRIYVEDVMTFTDKLSLREGLNYNIYSVEGKTYSSLQPRFSLRYSIIDALSFKAGYSLMNQNIHLLSNGMFSLPTDMWLPVTGKIKPITAHQFSAGLFYEWKYDINMGVEAYYKKLYNVIDYKDGVSSFASSTDWENLVSQGEGKAYGIEFNVQKNTGIVSGWISYTLSWATRQYADGTINNGKEFYDRYDVRNQLNIVLTSSLGKGWNVNCAFVVNSGSRTNIPVANYYNPLATNIDNMFLVNIYGEKNNLCLPTYHRLDIGITHSKKVKYGERAWTLSVYNAYNHKNAFLVMNSEKPNVLTAYSIMPIIPTLSYSLKFR